MCGWRYEHTHKPHPHRPRIHRAITSYAPSRIRFHAAGMGCKLQTQGRTRPGGAVLKTTSNPAPSACTGKFPFASKADASASARNVSRRKSVPACPYKCMHCGSWHVGTKLHKPAVTRKPRDLNAVADNFSFYEEEKHAWLAMHPNATPEQFEAACRAIAERLGV